MKILVFDPKWIEPAKALYLRTGIEIETEDWKPEKGKAYILYGADRQIELLKYAQQQYDLVYILMKPETIKDEDFLKKCICITQDLERVKDWNEKDITTEYGVTEYLYHKNTSTDETTKLETININDEDVVEKTNQFCNSKIYVSRVKNDWDNIHKALACGCQVISCKEDVAWEQMYSPFVLFCDEPDEADLDLLPPSDYEKFLSTVMTYSLNKMLPVIKNVFLQTEGERKEKRVMVASGKDEDGKAFVDICSKEEEGQPPSEV